MSGWMIHFVRKRSTSAGFGDPLRPDSAIHFDRIRRSTSAGIRRRVRREQWFGGGAAVRRGPDAGNVGKVLRLRVRESGGAGWQVRSVPVRGDGRLMMSRRRRMNAAASRPAIVRARAGEDRRPPVFGKSGLQSAASCESPLYVPASLGTGFTGRAEPTAAELAPTAQQRDVGGSGRSWGSSPVERAHDGMNRADDTGSGESVSLSAESGLCGVDPGSACSSTRRTNDLRQLIGCRDSA